MKRIAFLCISAVWMICTAYAQGFTDERLQVDHEFSITDSKTAPYTGYTERVNNTFITTIFAGSALKVARLSFSDEKLTSRHGSFTAYHASGGVLFESHYKRNRLNGIWNSWYENRVGCDSGYLENGLPDGVWKSWYPDGQIRSIRSYSALKFHNLSDEIRRNNRVAFFHLTTIYRNNRNAYLQYTEPGYSFSSLPLPQQNKLPGRISLIAIAEMNTSAENKVYIPPFTRCLHHGLYMNYYPNGAAKDSGFYKNGLREGVWMETLDEGNTRAIGYYRHGQKKDTWKYYNTQGKLLHIRHYNRFGKLVGSKEFN